AEDVMIALELGHRMVRFETRAERRRPFVLGLLNEQHALREQRHVADVIRMGVRDGNVFDVGGLHAELIELGGKGLRPPPKGPSRIGGALTLGHGGDGVGHTGIPQEPALAVLNQVAASTKSIDLPTFTPGDQREMSPTTPSPQFKMYRRSTPDVGPCADACVSASANVTAKAKPSAISCMAFLLRFELGASAMTASNTIITRS